MCAGRANRRARRDRLQSQGGARARRSHQIPRLYARKRHEDGDEASAYFERTECVAGVQDARFQQLMPDVIHWLGLKRIDRFISMSDMKYDALTGQGVEIVERVAIPDDMIPADAHVEMAAKKAAGYFSPDPEPRDPKGSVAACLKNTDVAGHSL